MCGNKKQKEYAEKQKEYAEIWKTTMENPQAAKYTDEQRYLFKFIGYAVEL